MTDWKVFADRWRQAGVLDADTYQRIEQFEAKRPAEAPAAEAKAGLRWPVIIAVAFGAVLLGAGVLLFIAAHWEEMSPSSRFSIVLGMVAAFHLAGALFAERHAAMSAALHAVGTVALGAGIALAGQIFNLEEHWPNGILMWAIGAIIGWFVLKQWPQALLAALLVPSWLIGEWEVRVEYVFHRGEYIVACGVLMLAVTYFTGLRAHEKIPVKRALMWIGGIGLIPAIGWVVGESYYDGRWNATAIPVTHLIVGWFFAIAVPLALSVYLRGKAALANGVAAVWIILLWEIGRGENIEHNYLAYLWLMLGAIGLIYWGVRELRKERINFGVAIFALTVMGFYFSSVLDKLGRSTALISLGILFLVGGWVMERTRRRLVQSISGGTA